MSEGGLKYDSGKPKMSLVTTECIAGIARALEYGAAKYGRNNYKKGMDWTRVIDALMRHTRSFTDKEDNDTESGLNHLYHAGACINMLIYYYEKQVGNDDR